MPWNGSGTFTLSDGVRSGSNVFQQEDAAGIDIEASSLDAVAADLAVGIQETLNVNGETSPNSDIDWDNHKITSLGDPTGSLDAVNVRSLQRQTVAFATTSGTGAAYVANFSPAITVLTRGMRLTVESHIDNTGPCTLAINGLTAVTMRDYKGLELPPGELQAGTIEEFWYTGTQWRMVNKPEAPAGTVRASGADVEDSGWVFGFGQDVSRTTYARLFDAYGTRYGVGDGSTTFGLPDFRGRVIAGQDDMGGTSANRLTSSGGGVNGDALGGTGGSEEHVLTNDQMPRHNHNSDAGNVNVVAQSGNDGNANLTTGGGARSFETFTYEGSDDPHPNVQPTIIMNWMIKA